MSDNLQRVHYDENGTFVICHECKNRSIDIENEVEKFLEFIEGKENLFTVVTLEGHYREFIKGDHEGGKSI